MHCVVCHLQCDIILFLIHIFFKYESERFDLFILIYSNRIRIVVILLHIFIYIRTYIFNADILDVFL